MSHTALTDSTEQVTTSTRRNLWNQYKEIYVQTCQAEDKYLQKLCSSQFISEVECMACYPAWSVENEKTHPPKVLASEEEAEDKITTPHHRGPPEGKGNRHRPDASEEAYQGSPQTPTFLDYKIRVEQLEEEVKDRDGSVVRFASLVQHQNKEILILQSSLRKMLSIVIPEFEAFADELIASCKCHLEESPEEGKPEKAKEGFDCQSITAKMYSVIEQGSNESL